MEPVTKPLKILIVEDNPDDAALIVHHLERAEFNPLATRVETEPEYLDELAKEPDIVIFDYAMPEFNGLRAIDLLSASGKNIPLILVSGTVGEDVAVEAMRHGATDYLLKDRLARLPNAVSRALNEQQMRLERKRNEEALRESEGMFRLIAENIKEVFWLTDPLNNSILYVSRVYETIWQRSTEELILNPSSWFDTVHPEDRQRVEAASAKSSTKQFDQVYRILRPDNSVRWIHTRGFHIKNQQGEVYRIVGTSEDITEHRKLEDQFRQSQKLEAIGTLSGGIAHDFNNILGGIIGYAELTKMEVADNPEAVTNLNALLQGANRATTLVQQIMTFSRQRDFHCHPVQLESVIQESLQLLRATIPATVRFDVKFQSGMPQVLADTTQVHQIVMNLCTNASHAMLHRSGTFKIRSETVKLDEKVAKAHAIPEAGYFVCLSLSDTGCGMNAETLQHIFEPFFTTKPQGMGTGLGLSAVHGIMKNHNGAVTVHSQPGEGTVFKLYFPIHQEEPAKSEVKDPEIPRGQGEHVLFVDDEEALVFLGSTVLKTLGYKVTSSTDADDLLEKFRADPADFDLVITDLTMPHMSGLAFTNEIKKLRTDLPVVLTTGYSQDLTKEQAREMGIQEILLKPLSREGLGKAVRRVLDEVSTN